MDFKSLWMTLFGTTELLGIDMGFWVGMIVVALIVVVMNVVLWNVKPLDAVEQKRDLVKKRRL